MTVKEPHYDSARAAHRKDPRRKALLIALTESYCCPAAALEFVQTRTSPEAETWRDELPGHVWIAGRIVESMKWEAATDEACRRTGIFRLRV